MIRNIQKDIFRNSPRFLNYYLKEDTRHQHPCLIQDTPNARKRALAAGAVYFDTLSFLRREYSLAEERRYFGDFYCVISRHNDLPIERFLYNVSDDIPNNLMIRFNLEDIRAFSFLYLSYEGNVIGIRISAAAFGMLNGAPFLHEIYHNFSKSLLAPPTFSSRPRMEVQYTPFMDAPNRRLPLGEHAVPLTQEEIHGASLDDLRQLASIPREIPPLKCARSMGNREFLQIQAQGEAQGRKKLTDHGSKSAKPHWPSHTPLIKPSGTPSDPDVSGNDIKCALHLSEWIRRRGIREFRQRDALKAVDGTFKRDSGVVQALIILQNHNVISVCEPLVPTLPGRPVGPWFIVNPDFQDRGKT